MFSQNKIRDKEVISDIVNSVSKEVLFNKKVDMNVEFFVDFEDIFEFVAMLVFD